MSAPDPVAVLHSLGWTAARPPQPVTGGWDNHLWRFDAGDGRTHALRMYRMSGTRARQRAEHEAAAMAAAAAAGLPVAKNEAVDLARDEPVFVQEWMPGGPLLGVLQKKPWQLRSLAHQFGALQAQVHRVVPDSTIRRLGAADVRMTITDERIVAALEREARIDTLCHLDYHPLNVLAEGGRITALLDWSNAAVTDRRADLAFTELALLHIPLPRSPLRPLLQLARRLLYRGWREGYRREAGEFPLTPLFRAAAILGYLADLEQAVADGRGWATATDVTAMRSVRDRLVQEAGFPPAPPSV